MWIRNGWHAILAIAISGLLSNSNADAQQPPTMEDRLSDPVYMTWVSEPAVSACIQCHFDGPGDAVIASGQSTQLNAFSRRQEMDAWVQRDKHTIARRRVEPFTESQLETELLELYDRLQSRIDEVVSVYRSKGYRLDYDNIGLKEVPEEWVGTSNVLSRRICDKLWGDNAVDTPEGYAKFREACLTCHGGVTEETVRGEGVLSKHSIGIDCLFCHQEGNQTEWQKKHFDNEKWRLSSPAQKRALGMSDMVNTANQASMCLDCHVGNRKRNMFVTHPMYAAGHPPLPSVEVQTFSKQMPQHWQTPSQLYENLGQDPTRAEYFAINYPGVVGADALRAEKTYWDTRKVFIGAITARKKAVQLMVDTAPTNDWGDYALFDCAACHHELQAESFRQQRYLTATRESVPGRPRPHEWQSVLLDVAYRLGGRNRYAEIASLESELAKCFDEKPFGNPESIAKVGTRLLAKLEDLTATVQTRGVDERLARVALKAIAGTDEAKLLTYDSARQAVWAINAISSELNRSNSPLDAEVQSTIEQLNDSDITGLDTDLPSGRKQYIFPEHLQAELARRATFRPDALADLLQTIADK
ncbi:MAG: hypothetical protein ACF787_11315 [Rhodopirellula sp. JB053]